MGFLCAMCCLWSSSLLVSLEASILPRWLSPSTVGCAAVLNTPILMHQRGQWRPYCTSATFSGDCDRWRWFIPLEKHVVAVLLLKRFSVLYTQTLKKNIKKLTKLNNVSALFVRRRKHITNCCMKTVRVPGKVTIDLLASRKLPCC